MYNVTNALDSISNVFSYFETLGEQRNSFKGFGVFRDCKGLKVELYML
jgi:hypothetical protein